MDCNLLGQAARCFTLDNGAQCIIIENLSALRCSLTIRVNAGSDLDPPDLVGLSKFVAVSLRRGSGNYPGLHNLERFLERTESEMSTTFYNPYIDFDCSTNFEHLGKMLNRLSDAMAVPTLSEDCLQLVLDDLNRLDQSARRSVDDHVNMVQCDLMGLPTIGMRQVAETRDIIKRAREFIPRYYTPSNMSLIMVVNRSTSHQQMLEKIKRNFNDVLDQSSNVSSAHMETVQVSPRRNAYKWYQSLTNRVTENLDKFSVLCTHTRTLQGPPPVSFERACGQQLSEHRGRADPGWGTGNRVGGDQDALENEFSGDIVTIVPVLVDSKDQKLVLTYRIDSDGFRIGSSGLLIWQYVLGREETGSLRHYLMTKGLVETVRTDVRDWGKGGMFFVVTLALTPSGFLRSEFVLKRVLDYVKSMQQNLDVNEDLYKRSLAWKEVEMYACMLAPGADHRGWIEVVSYLKISESEFDGNVWTEKYGLDPYEVRYVGELLRPCNCMAIILSPTFYNIGNFRPDNLTLRFSKSLVNLRHISRDEDLTTQQGPDLPPPKFDLIARSDVRSKRDGFVQISSSPFSAQLWFPGKFVSAKIAVPVLSSRTSIRSEVAGRLLATFLNNRLWPLTGKRFRASAEFAHSVLTLSICSSPDDVKHVVRLIFDLIADRSSSSAQDVFSKSVEQYRSRLIVNELAPDFELGFEESIGSRHVLTELQSLEENVTADDLPSVINGYFSMLLVGNVRHAHTLEVSNLVGQLLGNDAGVAYHRPVPNLDLPTEIFNVTGHRTLSEHSSDGCGILRAFDLGPTGPGSLCLASVMANYANTVLEQDLKIGHMYTSETNLRVVNMRGHIWFIVEIIGLREVRYVEPKLNRSLFVSMKNAFGDINEQDMKAARKRVLEQYFDRRKTANEELERMWEPIATEGVAYDHAIWIKLHSLFARDVANWFNRCVLTRETRRCVRVTYSNRAVEESRPLDEDDISYEDRVRRRPDSDDEEIVQVSVSSDPQDAPQDEDPGQDSEDIGTDPGQDSSPGEGSEAQLDE